MNLNAFPFLADENIHPDVLLFLREQGYDVLSVYDLGLVGDSDTAVLRTAYQLGRVVISHDSDFGALAFAKNEPFVGIVYLRPGHISPQFIIEMLQTVIGRQIDVQPPFIIVALRKLDTVHIRIRHSQ